MRSIGVVMTASVLDFQLVYCVLTHVLRSEYAPIKFFFFFFKIAMDSDLQDVQSINIILETARENAASPTRSK